MAGFDIAVIGGGLVGAAIAYGMAATPGLRIALLDEGDSAFRASRANFALVWVQGKGHGAPAYARLTRRAAELWPEFAAELQEVSGVGTGFRQPGGFTLALSPAELETRARLLAEVQGQPAVADLGCEIIHRNELMRLIPQIGPQVEGASYCPHDGHCNAPRLLLALHLGLKRRGSQVLTDHGVQVITRGAGGFRLATAAGLVEADRVVLAAGLGNAQLGPMVGLEAPLRPLKGQVIVTEKMAPFLHHPIVNIRQTDEGGVMVGSSMEDVGYDVESRLSVTAGIARRALRMLPCLAEVQLLRSWAGLRVMTPDGLPLYDRSTSHPGAVICNCHSGVTLASVHALTIGPALVTGQFDPTLQPFSAARFRVRETA